MSDRDSDGRGTSGSSFQFCDDCGSMMRPEDGRMVCTNCGAIAERDEALGSRFTSTERQSTDDVVETEEGAMDEGKPSMETTCERCGHGEAWYTIKQTASADEPPTRFFKCKECGHRWREYG